MRIWIDKGFYIQPRVIERKGREYYLSLEYQVFGEDGAAVSGSYRGEGSLEANRLLQAWKYAEQKGPFPPGVATYGGLAARRRAGKAYVTDGNHRTLAADYRGDVAIRMFMPQDEYETFVNDARFRELVS